MFFLNMHSLRSGFFAIICSLCLTMLPSLVVAQDVMISKTLIAPNLDLSIKYFSRELTPDGVLHETSYEEKMLRRSGHVWTWRVLPNLSTNDTTNSKHGHKDFNYTQLPRHINLEGNKMRVNFINERAQQIIAIASTEYENVNFDGSWLNAFFLIDPQLVAVIPVSSRISTAANSRWHEIERNGLFQRVLWDARLSIPLIIETGDRKRGLLQRITVSPNTKLTQDLPWLHVQGFTQKEYSDFLD